MNPTTGTVKHVNVSDRKKGHEDRWKGYESIYAGTTFEDAEKDAADANFNDRMERYLAAVNNARDLLDSASSEVESVHGHSNSALSQAKDDATADPDQCEAAVKNAKVAINRQIKGLEEMVDE